MRRHEEVCGPVAATGDLNWPAYYLIIAAAVGAVATWLLHEPNRRRMRGSAPAAASKQEAREMATEMAQRSG